MASPNDIFTSGQILTAQECNNLPFGYAGSQTVTTAFTTSGTHTTYQDTNWTLTINEVSGRLYRINLCDFPYPSGGNQAMSLQLLRGASPLVTWSISTLLATTTQTFPLMRSYVYQSSSSGSFTYKFQLKADAANTAVALYGDANFVRQFWIEDIGTA